MNNGVTSINNLPIALEKIWDEKKQIIKQQMISRGHRASNELRNASQIVLRGQRHGRRYKVPGTYKRQRDRYDGKMKNGVYYTASAPGEPPAVRTGAFRLSWQPRVQVDYTQDGYEWAVVSQVESRQKTDNGKYLLGEILEEGTGKMAPRPHQEKIQNKAMNNISKIYNEPYL